jgi:RND family efflux transporter MFP subunit
MKRFLWVVGILALIGALALSTKRFLVTRSKSDPTTAAAVRVAGRDIGAVVTATGVIKPMVGAEVRVGSSASGVVTRLNAQIGDYVKQGEVLADVDSRELDAKRDAAQAAVRLAKANLDYAQTDLHRKQELFNDQIIARSELDIAQQAYGVADQQYKQAQANLADAITQLGYARIVAPISGTVESVTTQEGETVASSFAAPTFVTLLDLSRLEVWAYVDETDIGRIRIGQKAEFTVDTYGDHEFPGQVTAIYPQAQIRDNVVDYIAVIRFKPPRGYILRPEMTTNVTIVQQEHKDVLSIPIGAVHLEGGRHYVIVRKGASTEQRWVTTGLKDDTYWEITSGLQEGEEVLVGNPTKQ